MFNRIRSLLDENAAAEQGADDEVEMLRLAIAVVLVKAAKSDSHFAQSEYDIIAATLERKLELPPGKVDVLLRQADQAEDSSVVDEAIAELKVKLTVAEREEILALVWRIIGADMKFALEENDFSQALRKSLGLDLMQAVRARKIAEESQIDGFKEFVEATSDVIDAIKREQED